VTPTIPRWWGVVCVFRACCPDGIFFSHCRVCRHCVVAYCYLMYALTNTLLNIMQIKVVYIYIKRELTARVILVHRRHLPHLHRLRLGIDGSPLPLLAAPAT
jgi:hypothetical protein